MTKIVGSIADLLVALEEDYAGYKGSVWYRGQADADWSLLPGYLRSGRALSEGTLISRFRQSAAMLTERFPRESFDWLFLMQHYGVPTRLLDWSESPLVALYFALNDPGADPAHDAALWSLKPTELNKHANIVDRDEEHYIPSFEDDELKPYSYEGLSGNRRNKLLPVATIATRNNARIQAQMGVFTIHHNDDVSIEAVGDSSHVLKYLIPQDRKARLSADLSLLGFNRFSVFPEMSSIGQIIKDSLR